jgi:serine/threonine-protein kinase SRPK3
MLQSGKYSSCYFDENGKLLHNAQVQFSGLFNLLTEKYKWQRQEAEEFCDFLLPMLSLDPEERVTAAECLKHPWLKQKTSCKRTKVTRKQHVLHRYEPYRLRPRN